MSHILNLLACAYVLNEKRQNKSFQSLGGTHIVMWRAFMRYCIFGGEYMGWYLFGKGWNKTSPHF